MGWQNCLPRGYTKGDHDFLARRLYRKIEDISDLKINRFFPRVRTGEHVCHVKRSCTTGDHDFPEVIVASTILPGSLPVSPRGKMLYTRIYGCAYRLFTRTGTRARTRKRFCILWSLLNSLAGLIIICYLVAILQNSLCSSEEGYVHNKWRRWCFQHSATCSCTKWQW